ncbi:sugar kinase [Nanchangia anserum]|uniref:Sugar kinase n=1 Tax=Nanchangia anserum TaxID=2692125 RepID=A0A8I0GGP4_9ACTO|nr:sugar kinase [Nanchangia anserum]MBD3689689.1 sugar kinase [Nanchangia anserum]QOX81866.1 sugar kinase [Nanchangia anserum]
MTAFDLTTLGEGQIRLTCLKGERLGSARQLRMSAACSEANVSGLLSQLGRKCSWATILPKGHALTKRIFSEYRSVGVDLSNVVRSEGGRVALYFMEPGEYPMPARVMYDREHTPFRDMTVDMFNWDSLLDTRVVFVTGITTALTENTAKVVRYFVDQAVERGVEVILDVNYRSMLWDAEQAHAVLDPIARASTVVFCSRKDTEIIYGITGEGEDVCRKLREEIGVNYVVSTDQVRGVYLSGPEGEQTFSVHPVPVVDRPGAGDSFVAGTIHGYLQGNIVDGVRYGQRTSAYALTHHGDLTYFSPTELDIPVTTDIVR